MAVTLNASVRSYRDWTTQFQFNDADSGALIDFTGASITIAIEDQDRVALVTASTGNGMITIVSTGVIQLSIPYSQMNLPAGYYGIGGYYQLNGETIDLFAGELAVQRGIPKL